MKHFLAPLSRDERAILRSMARPRIKSAAPWVTRDKRRGVWVARWREYDAAGNETRRPQRDIASSRKMSKAQAAIEAQRICQQEIGPINEGWTFSRLVDLFAGTLDRYAANTQATWRCVLERFKPLLTGPLADIKPMHVEQAIKTLGAGRSPATIHTYAVALRAAFELGVDNDLIPKNPARKVARQRRRTSQATRLLSEREFASVMGAQGRSGLAVRVLAVCGLRRGELIALRRQDVQGRALVIRATESRGKIQPWPKSRRPRIVMMSARLAADLHAFMETSPYRAPEAFVFHRLDGHFLWPQADVLQIMAELRETLGIPDLTPRLCRHAYATYLEADAADVQESLGHADLSTTLAHYREPIRARQEVAADRLEERYSGETKGPVN